MSVPNGRAKPLVVGVCRYCAGQGHVPAVDEHGAEVADAYIKCARCNGTGDLDEMRLLEAYRLGHEDALADLGVYLRELRGMAGLAADRAENWHPTVNYERLRARIGG